MSKILKRVLARQLKLADKKYLEELMRLYLKDEPIVKYINLSKEDTEIYVEAHTQHYLGSNGAALGFCDVDTGNIVGCIAVSLPSKSGGLSNFTKIGPISEKLRTIIRFDDYTEAFIKDVEDGDNALMMDLGVVKPEYRGLHLVSSNWPWVLNFAERHNCKLVVNVATNLYSHRVNEQVEGFVPVKSINYKDYRDPVTGEAVMVGMPLPHTKATMFVYRIKNKPKL